MLLIENVWSLPPACLSSVGTFVNFSDCFPITIISPCGALDHFSPLFVWKIILEAAIFIPDWYYDKLVLFPHMPYKKDIFFLFFRRNYSSILRNKNTDVSFREKYYQHFRILLQKICWATFIFIFDWKFWFVIDVFPRLLL